MFIVSLLILLYSCKEKNATISIKTHNEHPIESYFLEKPNRYYYSYDYSISEIENFNSGYVDTFSVANTKFQLLSNPDSLGDLELQVMKNDKWYTNLRLPYAINGNEVATDINQDGFKDFHSSLLRGSKVYLFDSQNKQFYQEPIYLAFEWSIIDKKEKLYINNYSTHDYNETNLFKLDGFKQIFYYDAPIKYEIGAGVETATIRLYKIRNNNLDDTIFISQQKIDILHSDFDYKKFWSDIIKKNGYP